MISKHLPGFCFDDPTNKETVNIRFTSVEVNVNTRRVRAIWTPEMAQDLQAFHNIDTETELTALLGNNLREEIDRQIIQDLNDNQRFYQQNNRFRDVFNRWGNLINDTTDRTFTTWYDTPIIPNHLRRIDYDTEIRQDWLQPLIRIPEHTILPDENGWFMKGVFESLLIKMEMKDHRFLKRKRYRNNNYM